MAKTSDQTSERKKRDLVPQPHGGALRPGGDGVSGGRPSNEWRARMKALADRWAQAAEAQKVLDNPDDPNWMAAGRFVAEQAYGKPRETEEAGARVMRFVFVDEGSTKAVEIIDGGE